MNTVFQFFQAKEKNPDLSKNQICKKVGISDQV